MKQSELKSFIKENIIDILSEVSDEELENLCLTIEFPDDHKVISFVPA